MFRLLVVYFIVCVSANRLRPNRQQRDRKNLALLKLHPHYHSSEDIHDELVALAKRCPALTVEQREGVGSKNETRLIDIVTIRAPGAKPVSKNFFLFGEHARELVSTESGLHFAKTLCGETTPALKKQAAKVLQSSEFQFIVNSNPESRKKVEEGQYCLRVNPNGVDLNRNWDDHFENSWHPDANPGTESFSEAETRLFRDVVTAYKPTQFLSIHSGTFGMYMPWAYDSEHLAKRNRHKMMDILRSVDEKHCKCPFGSAGKEVGYDCPGTSLDWVYDKLKTPYAFAFEIYTSDDRLSSLQERWQEATKSIKGAFLQFSSHLGHEHFRDVFSHHPSSFVQLRTEASASSSANLSQQEDPMDCFSMFNPGPKEKYDKVMENWSGAYLEMAEKVAFNLASGASSLEESSEDDEGDQ